MYLARSTPSFSIRDSSASSHSLVSMGSSSWYIKPSPWTQKVPRGPRSAACHGANLKCCDNLQFYCGYISLREMLNSAFDLSTSIEQLSHFSCRAGRLRAELLAPNFPTPAALSAPHAKTFVLLLQNEPEKQTNSRLKC